MTIETCPSCSRSFNSQTGLRVHYTRVHDEKLQTEECKHPDCTQKHNNKKYCSNKCSSDHLKEQDGWRNSVSEGLPEDHSQGGNNANYGKTGEAHPAFGTERSKEVRRQIGPDRGPSHFAWKPGSGIGIGPFWQKQRTETLERDDYQCVVCGAKEKLDVHHVTPRRFVYYHPFFRWEDVNNLENLVTMCKTHHKRADLSGNYWNQYPEGVTGFEGEFKL